MPSTYCILMQGVLGRCQGIAMQLLGRCASMSVVVAVLLIQVRRVSPYVPVIL